MKASDANSIANANNRFKNPLEEIFEKISEAANRGEFDTKVPSDDPDEHKIKLEKLGYDVEISAEQVDNTQEYFLTISWDF